MKGIFFLPLLLVVCLMTATATKAHKSHRALLVKSNHHQQQQQHQHQNSVPFIIVSESDSESKSNSHIHSLTYTDAETETDHDSSLYFNQKQQQQQQHQEIITKNRLPVSSSAYNFHTLFSKDNYNLHCHKATLIAHQPNVSFISFINQY
jgi:hypothetical protein